MYAQTKPHLFRTYNGQWGCILWRVAGGIGETIFEAWNNYLADLKNRQ